jgi:hypothetical protein
VRLEIHSVEFLALPSSTAETKRASLTTDNPIGIEPWTGLSVVASHRCS